MEHRELRLCVERAKAVRFSAAVAIVTGRRGQVATADRANKPLPPQCSSIATAMFVQDPDMDELLQIEMLESGRPDRRAPLCHACRGQVERPRRSWLRGVRHQLFGGVPRCTIHLGTVFGCAWLCFGSYIIYKNAAQHLGTREHIDCPSILGSLLWRPSQPGAFSPVIKDPSN